jgi:hypothetical protein
MKRSLALLAVSAACALSAPPAARAVADNAGTGGAAFTKIGIGSARAMAMGRAYVSLAEGAEAMTYNPAGLALAQQRELTYSYLRYVQDISAPFFMGYAHPFGRTVIGANASYLSVSGFDVRDANGIPLDNSNVRVQNGYGTLAIARSFLYEKLFLGGGLRYIHEDDAGTIHNATVGDVGVMFRPNSYLSFGAAIQDFGASTAQVARVSRLGASTRLFELLTLSVELTKPADNVARAGIGAEFILPEDFLQVGQIALRVGYRGTDDLGHVLVEDRSFLYPLISSPQISYGVGLYSAQAFGYGIGFDYAIVPLGALGTVDQLSLRVKF